MRHFTLIEVLSDAWHVRKLLEHINIADCLYRFLQAQTSIRSETLSDWTYSPQIWHRTKITSVNVVYIDI